MPDPHCMAWAAHGVLPLTCAAITPPLFYQKPIPSLFPSSSTKADLTTVTMHISYALITALLTYTVSSQTVADLVSQLPSCALLCLATSSTAASCGLADYACQCGPARAAITTSATPCILSKCSSDDAASTSHASPSPGRANLLQRS